jgi:hypothetical protein
MSTNGHTPQPQLGMVDAVQVMALTQPAQFKTSTIVVNGKNLVVLEVQRPADLTVMALEPKTVMELGQHLLRAGREALTGLTIVGGSGAVLPVEPKAE